MLFNPEYHKRAAVRCREFVRNFEKGTDIYKLINFQVNQFEDLWRKS
jgi:hypothetical protein